MGFAIPELGIFQDEEQASKAIQYLTDGLSKDEVVALVKVDNESAMTTRKKKQGSESGKQVNPNPENVLEQSSSVYEAEVNFGGIKNAGFMDFNGTPTVLNAGTGRKINSLFLPLSGKANGGKVDILEARARIAHCTKVLFEHITVLETVDSYLKGKGDNMGIDTTPVAE